MDNDGKRSSAIWPLIFEKTNKIKYEIKYVYISQTLIYCTTKVIIPTCYLLTLADPEGKKAPRKLSQYIFIKFIPPKFA